MTGSLLAAVPTSRVRPEAPAAAYGPTERLYEIRKKPNHIPAVQRWSALFPEDQLCVGIFGVQSQDVEALSSSAFMSWIDSALTSHANGPSTLDHARFTDAAGYANHVVTAYWPRSAAYEAWRADPAVNGWWMSSERLSDTTGVWREMFRIATDRVETIYWLDYPGGVMRDPEIKLYPTPYCGYYGAMRDRLPVAANDSLEAKAPLDQVTQGSERESYGARWRVTAPANVAIIRSSHTWSAMDEEQFDDYSRKLAPPLDRGMKYLEENPSTGCLTLRNHLTVDPSGEVLPEMHATGMFIDLKHMEEWSESHRTHAAIFSAAMTRYKHYGSRNQLRTWHEVYVLPEPTNDNQLFEYVNCHPSTGLLPYFQGERLA